MMKPLRIWAVQPDLQWEQPAANRARIQSMIEAQPGQADLIVLPEMFTTGFSMRAKALAEPMEGETVRWMERMADRHQALICGSLIIAEDRRYYNRMVMAAPQEGVLAEYDKRHLFPLAGEHQHYARGESMTWAEYKGWRMAPMICYDLRFPVWSRNTITDSDTLRYDLLLYVANWPAARIQHWEILLRARAIENQAFVIGVNRVGTDGAGLSYPGASVILDPQGQVLAEGGASESVLSAVLDPAQLQSYRKQFPFWQDTDLFEIYP
ncbi:MAG: amidohydrolase [Bacteroidia bacterium]|nr:amidohydrolase [Bacteroidia bacterium]